MDVGSTRHLVSVQNPGEEVPDGGGGYTQGWTPLVPPTWYCSIRPASTRDLERVTAGTVITTATHILRGRHHPQMSTKTQVQFNDPQRGLRTFTVTSVINPDERDIETAVICEERVP